VTPPRVLVAAGGTGGHVYPAVATALALRDSGAEAVFVGTARGIEARVVPEYGFRLHHVAMTGLPRRPSVQLVRLPWMLARAVRSSRRLLSAEQAVAACVFGGYVSVPVALAARLARVPLAVHEQNAVPGLANRLAAWWAAAVAASFPDTQHRFPHPDVVRFTGNPVRPDLAALVDRDRRALRHEAHERFRLEPDRRTLLAFGGSQGARRINEAVVGTVGLWAAPERLQVLHVAGHRDYAAVRAAWDAECSAPGVHPPLVRCVDFVEEMGVAYAAADLALCRAGASTLAELTLLGVPSVLVPYPHATADHQAHNARHLAAAGAARLVADADLRPPRVVDLAEALLLDDAARARMAHAARAVGQPDAARRVADLVRAIGGLTGGGSSASLSEGDR
jgi:UDP-N-acetylglucosamine--N-acetylmuramyl-(pentapeptide) pyrophosphoryl-undecaprenol N-acetylglucosamine transferase